jgi:hypothetical protein
MTNQQQLLDAVEPDLSSRIVARRDLFRSAAMKLGALASAPLVLAAVSTQAFSEGMPAQVVDVLNFALTLEYLEDEFYRKALAQSGLIDPQFAAVFQQISKHETEHVETLKAALGSAAAARPEFDFSAKGKYAEVFSSFKTFALISQTFEETGVAAYKGQAPALMGSGSVLTTALQIHSVEARHAAEVRRVRGVELWPAAFDKPMTKEEVLAAVKPFIVG